MNESWALEQIRDLLASENPEDLTQARELTRTILTRLTTSLIQTLATRQQLMTLIAASKRKSEAILQLEREYVLLEHFRKISGELWLDPDFVTQFVWLVTAAWKEAQRQVLDRPTVFVSEEISQEVLKRNLLDLTRAVAPTYDTYGNEFSATRLMREYERWKILDVAWSVSHRWVALDIGCANGGIAEMLVEVWFDRVLGVDLSPDMIKAAGANSSRKSEYLVHDVMEDGIPVADCSVDFIAVNFGAASEVSSDILPEVSRVLKSWGKAYLSFYNNDALSNTWWQPGQTSIEWVKNPLCDLIEVPIISNGEVTTYKCYARGTDMRGLSVRVKELSLSITSVESPGFLSSMLPPIFFRDSARTKIAMEYERGHAWVAPFIWPYLNVVVEKERAFEDARGL